MKRIVIKVGSNVLTRSDGTLDTTRMSAIVDQVVRISRQGIEVILVSSGAVACGRTMVKPKSKLDSVEQRQLYSAIGQVRLMQLYFNLFRDWGISIGQVLTMKESFSTRREYLNQRSCMEVMLQNKVIPIVNENDTVSVTELMFTDNDELSGLVASMMCADTLIILSNVDGIYNGKPEAEGVSVIPRVLPDDDISCFIGTHKSGFGRGGMLTKCRIARQVAGEGIRVIVANGKRDGILDALIQDADSVVHTEFVPQVQDVSSVKKWIAHSEGFVKGSVTVDDNAAKALHSKEAASLLAVGVVAVEGDFEEGDIISILDRKGKKLGIGRTSYSSREASEVMGAHDVKPVIHYDYLYLCHS